MTKIDQFESAFRAADKPVFQYRPVPLGRVALVTDLDSTSAPKFAESVHRYLSVLEGGPTWTTVTGDRFDSVGSLLELLDDLAPDLVVTYRHLHSEGWRWPHGLGEYLDVLTQRASYPVLVVPHPDAQLALPHSLTDTDRVMAITDHLAGDDRLVNYAVAFTAPKGTCDLTHIEDDAAFERFMSAVSKVPEIDTDMVREGVLRQLLREPSDYIASCRATLEAAGVDVQIEEHIDLGHRLAQYAKLIQDENVDLLVFNTKDEDQLAMHGLAYPLAVELRQIPLLML